MHFSDRIKLSPPKKKEIVRRGYIKDINGSILALSIESKSLYANPERIKDPEKTAKVLADVLQMNRKTLQKKLSYKNRRFIWLKRKLPDITAARITSLKIDGLALKNEFKRVYPHETLASHILGFTGIDNKGLSGIEYKYNSYLNGETDVENLDRDSIAYGMNINLTIDRYIQYTAEKYLAETVEKNGAKRGSVVVMDVQNGKILAFGIYPSYNPNYYYRYSAKERKIYSIVEPFEPGSTMKIFSAAAWLSTGNADLNKLYHGSGEITLYDTTIRSTHVNGWINMHDAIRLSCNVSVIRAMKEVKNELLYDTLKKFGFGQVICRDFPGESPGILRPVNQWSGLSKFSISIGQEISVNLLQLAAAFGAIANGGIYIEPSLIDSIEMNNGHELQKFYPKSRGRIFDQDKAEILRKMLAAVVESGTGENAKVDFYKVAGKTGTAQKSTSIGGYIDELYTASFAGFAPYNNPRLVIVVAVDEPTVRTHGGEVAAPVFANIVRDVLPYLGVGVAEFGSNKIIKNTADGVPFDGKVMPNLLGRDFADIGIFNVQVQKKYGIKVSVSGSGHVYEQLPEPGVKLQSINSITVKLR